MTLWDYQVMVVSHGKEVTYRTLEDDCKKMGQQGWELVTITEERNATKGQITQWWFKKQVAE